MIREANKFDKPAIAEMMREFRDSADFPEIHGANDEEYFGKLLDAIFAGAGKIFYAEGKGLLIALVAPSIWSDKVFVMNELAWYVKPEWRKGSTAYRLFDAYVQHGKELKQSGRIAYYTMTKLDVSPDLDYARYGFRKKDENWIQ